MNETHLAAIDIGTNSFHLLIAKIVGNSFQVVHHERIVFRLQEGNLKNSKISDIKIDEAIAQLKQFADTCTNYQAEVHAVATSALRDAENREVVRERILNETGINIKILSGDEEALLSFKAALFKKENLNQNSLVFDLGGGSLELIIGQKNNIVFKNSLQLGAVRMTNRYFPDFLITDERIGNCRDEIKSLLQNVKNEMSSFNFANCFGIGGTVTSLSWLIEKNIYQRDHHFQVLHDYIISKDDLRQVSKIILNKKSFEERKQIKGLDLKRADVIPAGVLIVDELFSEFHLQKIIAPGYSIKEGIILNAIQSN